MATENHGFTLLRHIADADNPYIGAQVNDGQIAWVLGNVPDGYARINGKWIRLEYFTQYRQRHEKGRIEVAQSSEAWMDGKSLYREVVGD